MEAELGNGWAEGVHPDDFAGCLEIYRGSFDARQLRRWRRWPRRHDGEFRWMLDNGIPRQGDAGKFQGYIGSCIDITERKRAEQERAALLARGGGRANPEARLRPPTAARMSSWATSSPIELRTPLNRHPRLGAAPARRRRRPRRRRRGLDTVVRETPSSSHN